MLTKADIKEIIDGAIEPVHKDIKILKRNDVKIKADINMVIGFFDRDYSNLRKRLERIEEHLGLSNN